MTAPTFTSTAPDRKQSAELNAARMEGFVEGYAAGREDAPFTAPPELVTALKACNKTWHKERKTAAMLQLVAILNGMMNPENGETDE